MTPRERAEEFASRWPLLGDSDRELAEFIEDLTTILQAQANEELERKRAGHFGDVREFCEKFGVPTPTRPGWPSQERIDLRVRLIAEEFCEFLRDAGYDFKVEIRDAPWNRVFSQDHDGDGTGNFPKVIDALLDMEYVINGTHLEFGIDPSAPWVRVHAANMRKVAGPVRDDGKILKPDGWTAPDIEGALREQGWEG